MRRAWLTSLLLHSACPADSSLDTAPHHGLHDEPPLIDRISFGCSSETPSWSFEVLTRGWTGSGTLYMATRTDYLERHVVRSVEAATDGTSDHLELDLLIVPDWRDAVSGASTAFLCNASTRAALNYRLMVHDTRGEDADCRSWGADPTFFDGLADVPACAEVWDPADANAGVAILPSSG
jgi:hypothetical protein